MMTLEAAQIQRTICNNNWVTLAAMARRLPLSRCKFGTLLWFRALSAILRNIAVPQELGN